MNRWTASLLLAVAVAALLRLPELDRRPMHNDEAVNAVKFGELWAGGGYRYDPDEHHGPTLHYLTALYGRLTGAPAYVDWNEVRFRCFSAVVGILSVGAFWLMRGALGSLAATAGAWLGAQSPVMVFYSRYWIHEGLLVLFAALGLAALWRWVREPNWWRSVVLGGALGLLCATKETVVFNLAAGGLALAGVWWLNRAAWQLPQLRRDFTRPALLVAGTTLFIAALLFTSFGQNPTGLLDAVRTYEPWFARAAGETPHQHPWWFYFERLLWFQRGHGPVWSEAAVLLLAVVGGVVGGRGQLRSINPHFVRGLAIYAVTLALIYAVIPYKTPWCVLTWWHPALVLAGVGVAALWTWCNTLATRALLLVGLLAAGAHLGGQAWRANFPLAAARTNPWVYSQTSPDLLNLVELAGEVVSAGAGFDTEVHVITREGDCWPLPWYLRRFHRVGYWENEADRAPAPVIISSAGLKLPDALAATHVEAGLFQLRPNVFLELRVERGLWAQHLRRTGAAGAPR